MRSKDASSADAVSVSVSASADAPPPARGRVAARVARATRRARARPGVTIVARASAACPIAVDAIPSRPRRAEPRGRQWRSYIVLPSHDGTRWAQLCARFARSRARSRPDSLDRRSIRSTGARPGPFNRRFIDERRSKARTIAVRPSQRPDSRWLRSRRLAIDRGDSNPETLRPAADVGHPRKYLRDAIWMTPRMADCVPYDRISTRIETALNRRSSSQCAHRRETCG